MSENEVAGQANGEYQMEVFSDSITMNGVTNQKTEERIGMSQWDSHYSQKSEDPYSRMLK